MQDSLLPIINLIAMLLGFSLLGHAIAQSHWRRGGTAGVILSIVVCGQIWMIPQAVGCFGFHSTRLLYSMWFGNWIVLAFGVMLFSVILRGSSRDLLDAARMDGSGFFGVYRHVGWPTLKPALAALAILLFMTTWAEFARPLALGQALHSHELALPLTSQGITMLIAASLLLTLPVIAIYFFARRIFLQGDPTAR
jgi:ABC-type glycerol-3-phosphate transport system permease component